MGFGTLNTLVLGHYPMRCFEHRASFSCLTAVPGVEIFIPAQSPTFVEIYHEIISAVILLPPADSFKKGCCQLQAKVCTQITGKPLVYRLLLFVVDMLSCLLFFLIKIDCFYSLSTCYRAYFFINRMTSHLGVI